MNCLRWPVLQWARCNQQLQMGQNYKNVKGDPPEGALTLFGLEAPGTLNRPKKGTPEHNGYVNIGEININKEHSKNKRRF